MFQGKEAVKTSPPTEETQDTKGAHTSWGVSEWLPPGQSNPSFPVYMHSSLGCALLVYLTPGNKHMTIKDPKPENHAK